MTTKLQFYCELAEQTLNNLTGHDNWTRFLNSSAKLYKYPFHDRLMIYAQRPDAVACAELELWNEKFNRWVRRGSKGIALIDDSGNYPRLKYVFDVSDTEAHERGRPVYLWEMRQEYKNAVLTALAKSYDDVSADDSLADAFRNIAKQLAAEYYKDNSRDILQRSENSILEPSAHYDSSGILIDVDDIYLESAFTETLANSIAYMTMVRCGLDPADYFDEEDFRSVYEFNTPDMINALGVASSDLSEQVLRDIELTIKKYERTRAAQPPAAERSEINNEPSISVHADRGLSPAQFETERVGTRPSGTERTDGAYRQIREDEESVSERTTANHVQPLVTDRDTVPAFEGDRRGGDSENVTSDEPIDSNEHPARQSDRPDGVDGGDERPESASGGNGTERTDIQLEEQSPSVEETDGETFSQIGKTGELPAAKSLEDILSTSKITLDEFDDILRDGGNYGHSTLRITAKFTKDKDFDYKANFLKGEYLGGKWDWRPKESGKGFHFNSTAQNNGRRISAWFDESGITLAMGESTHNNRHSVTIPWEQAAVRVNELMLEGKYISSTDFNHALENERYELADNLWDFYRDDMHEIPEEWQSGKGHPDDVEIIKTLLDDEDSRQAILDRLEADVIEWNYNSDRKSWGNPNRVLANMQDLMLPPVILPPALEEEQESPAAARRFTYFITEDEIDAYFTRGSNTSQSKFRILSYFLGDYSDKEKADFIKKEYGHGGGTYSEIDGWHNAEPGKGIWISRNGEGSISNPEAVASFKWNPAAKRISKLISEGRYMNRTELDRIQNYEKIELMIRVKNFYYDLPSEYERPFEDLELHYPKEADWEAVRAFLDDEERIDRVLSQMAQIFTNTSTEDRYYNNRKNALETLTAFREGTYTLFPGIENLPAPETAVQRTQTPATPRRERIEDLSDSPFFDSATGEFKESEQLSLFGDNLFPELPSVEEQRTKIEQVTKQNSEQKITEAEAKAPVISLPESFGTPLLDISDEDKTRIAAQFADNPRSREAVSLVREIYGDRLALPLPQAIKKITELVESGAFDLSEDPFTLFEQVREELSERGFAASGELVEDGINEYNANGGRGSFQDVADFIENEYLTEEVILEAEHEQPTESLKPAFLQECERIKAESGGAIVMWQLGDFYEMFGEDAERASEALGLTLTERSSVKMTGLPAHALSDYLQKFNEAGYNVAVASIGTDNERDVTLYSTKPQVENTPQYSIGDKLIYNNKPHEIDRIDEYVRIINLGAPAPYPVFDRISFRVHDFEQMLSGGMIVIDNNIKIPEKPAPVLKTIIELDFDAVAKTALERVMADERYTEALENAKTRISLRNPCGWALEKSIRNHEQDEPEVFHNYFRDNNFRDNLLSYVLKQSWEQRPLPIADEKTEVTVEPQIQEESESAPEHLSEVNQSATREIWYSVGDVVIFNGGNQEITDVSAETGAVTVRDMNGNSHYFSPEMFDALLLTNNYNREFRDSRMPPEQEEPAPVATPSHNFRITDNNLGEGGAKTKFRNNIKALKTLKDIEFDERTATPEEQEILSRYVGWGGVQQAFDPDNKDWTNEYLELNALLTPEEWESARSSVLNAHYTSPLVIKAIYETIERLGFKSGNILEPSCGVGNFLGLLPESMSGSKLYGVELDSVTARIAQQLYPNADIEQMGYEKAQFSDAFFDLAVGNVPFGGFGVIDNRYKTNFNIHDYFFQKTLDKVRPGGIIAFITSKGTLDKKNPEARKYIAQRAELLGAVRLPNNAFLKNAGTEATMDIIFLQKRDRPLEIEPDWIHLGLTDNDLPVNSYFLDNPEMLLGRMTNGPGTRLYGNDRSTTCEPFEGADLEKQLKAALSYIDGQYTPDELDNLDGVDNHAIPADPNVKNFSYTEIDGTVYFRENSLMYPVDLPAMTLDRVKGMIGLRDCVHKLIDLQLYDYSEAEIKAQQTTLNTLYDSFIAEFGLISSQANSRAFNADSAYYLLSSLEVLDENGELERKADMFTKRTIKQKTVVTHVDTASEALSVSIGEKALVDMEYMSQLTGKDEAGLFEELRGVIFLDFDGTIDSKYTYRTADDFLSGNVRDKLAKYEAAKANIDENNPHYEAICDNVKALTAIHPKDLEAGEISVRLGATWIEPKYIQQFMYELFKTASYNKSVYQVNYHPFTGEWQVTGKNKGQYSDINATVTYGTSRMNAYQILDDTLNLRDVRVYDIKEDADGKEKRVLNKKETMLAQQKQELIKQNFRDWLWSDPERRQTLVQKYNVLFNSTRSREYDGSHLTFAGMNPEIKLNKHQIDGAARQIYGGNTLYAHVVGAGKTFTMIAAAIESKRLGLCQKNLFAVPNHLTEQWAAEFMRLYPSANILVATKKDFEMRNRKRFCAKIATGDYDAVIIGHTQLEKIPMSRERQERQIREQIWEIEEGIREIKASRGERFTIKQLEKTKRSLELRLIKLLDSKKRDDVVTFEQLGVDRLNIDESHNFKNLFMYTKMRNVAGLSTTEAQKSSDLFMKCRYMDEITDNKGIIFATGTPVDTPHTSVIKPIYALPCFKKAS
jgi:N12 class adenine-specific DNA methylase